MRTNAIVRIVLFSLCILILTGVLLTGLGIWSFSLDLFDGKISQGTLVQESGSVFVQEADTAQIRNIEIDWAAGNIRIEPSDDVTAIQVQETQVAEKYQMSCKISGSTLQIQFTKKSLKFPSFGVDTVSKDLVITVPADWVCQELDIDAAAANVTIRNMTVGELDFDGASGICDLENCHVTSMDVDAASGDLTFSGVLGSLDFDGASADCTLVLTQCPRQIELDGMSGNMDITLPADCGFTVESQGLSSGFSTDFETTSRNGSYICGDGSCHIRLEALSGDLTIHNGGYACHDGQESHHSSHH